jgi:hypothetical protein
MMTTAAHSSAEIAEFWRVVRRLHTIYAELDRTFELGTPPCPELEQNVDGSDPQTLERVRQWFQSIDSQLHVWQLRQLLQSTNLQTEENLRYLIRRHLDKAQKTEADKEKIDFLLVQYFAHCAPHGVIEHHITLGGVARVLEPALGEQPVEFPDWTVRLDEKLDKMNHSNSLEELQDSGGLVEAREMKAAAGDQYFEPAFLVAFTRFNFLARRAFFRAMHLDLHAIRAAVNELERRGFATLDCRGAGLTESESLDQVRHLIHQWKTPFRAPYTAGGSSFQQLISLRQCLQRTLNNPQPKAETQGPRAVPTAAPSNSQKVAASPAPSAPPVATAATAPPLKAVPAATTPAVPLQTPAATPAASPAALPSAPRVTSEPKPEDHRSADEEGGFLQRCVADITEQLAAMPPKNTPSVSTINLGGCKLLIATWEAEAFKGNSATLRALQRAVAARTILHVCMERHKRNEPTDLSAALEIAQRQTEEIKIQVLQAKESSNIDAAVNLAATAKRLLALIDEGNKLHA